MAGMDPLHDNYRFLAQYNQWFNARLLDACERLTDLERKQDRVHSLTPCTTR